jgi:putative hemolysin
MQTVLDAAPATIRSPTRRLAASPTRRAASVRLEASWADSPEDLRAVQCLRYRVFAGEGGARVALPPGTPPGRDADRFDAFCAHLLLRASVDGGERGEVVGTCRVLTPEAARRAGGFHCETAFDLASLAPVRSRIAELGRSCIHPAWRTGGTLLALWSALGEFMARHGLDLALGFASVDMRDGGHAAASLWRQLSPTHLAPAGRRVRPLQPLPLEALRDDFEVETPPLLSAYLRCGAELLGPPARDPAFATAELPLLLALEGLPRLHRRPFLDERDT